MKAITALLMFGPIILLVQFLLGLLTGRVKIRELPPGVHFRIESRPEATK